MKLTSVESEVGRIPCTVHEKLASILKPKERVMSLSVQTLTLRLCAQNSYRNACSFLNAVFHRPDCDSFKLRTLADATESAGHRISLSMEEHCAAILEENGFDSASGLPKDQDGIPSSISSPVCGGEDPVADKPTLFRAEIEHYNSGREETCQIKDSTLINLVEQKTENCVYVSIDDVGVKHQKDSRGENGSKSSKNVENTVIHIQSAEGFYVLTAVGMDKAFRLLMAFLLGNGLLENRHLYFFSDGASNIRRSIETYFSFCPYVHMLDWYHLEKRMTELLSMALKGKKADRHNIRYMLDGMLWAGNIDDAESYLRSIEQKNVKNSLKLQEAIDYLERKRPYICCYALRSILDYRNSSNPAEKSNDIVVACRQKHNGMSWSYAGSNALAVITASVRNGELDRWILDGTMRFSPELPQKDEYPYAA